MKKSKVEMAVWHCLRQLYANATPPANFDELIEKADVNEQGQKVIDFMAYYVEKSKFEEIVQQTIKDFKLKKEMEIRDFKFLVYLGPSPTSRKPYDTSDCGEV